MRPHCYCNSQFHTALLCLLGLIVTLLILPVTAHADARSDYVAAVKGRADAPAVIAKAGVPCDIADALFLGRTPGADGERDLLAYEVACKVGTGYLIAQLDKGDVKDITNCLQAENYWQSNKFQPKCKLPLNLPNYRWLVPIAATLAPACEVSKARWIGKVPNSANSLYELGCKGASGGIYTINNWDAQPTTPPTYKSCLQMLGTAAACVFTAKKDIVSNYQAVARDAITGCKLIDIRYIGASATQTYLEAKCDGLNSVILALTPEGKLQTKIECADAAKLGGCKFATDQKQAAGAKTASSSAYAKSLADNGVPCTISDYVLVRTDAAAKADVIEFKCPEHPYGLVGNVPQTASSAKLDLTDCFIAKFRDYECRFFNLRALKARTSDLADENPKVKQDCVVDEVRFISVTVDQDVLVEIRCENRRGYIAMINPARDALTNVMPCNVAANRKDAEKCELPENGTFAGT